MTTYGQPRVWLDQFPPGEPQPFEHDYHGMRYPGEVIRADTWSPQWGEPLSGDVYFRIVLLSRRNSRASPVVNDPRTALCLPGTRVYRQRDRLVEELATLRETQALYATQRDPEADLIRRTLQRRQEGLEDELIAQEVNRYSSGTVTAGREGHAMSNDLFTGADPVSWFSSIAGWLLAQAYPNPPVDPELLSRPVTPEDPGQLYRAIFTQPGALPDILTLLGPGLGLSSPISPGVFNTESCSVFQLIRQWMQHPPDGQSKERSWSDLHHHLAHQIGLTRPLATLYLQVFLHQERPELEVRLSAEHQLSLSGGRPLPGARLTSDLLRHLEWDPRIAHWGTIIRPVTQPDWNDALPYVSSISADLSPAAEGENLSAQERHLQQDLRLLTQEVAQEFLDLLEQRAGGQQGAPRQPSEALARLSRISGSDFRAIYHSVRDIYSDYQHLEQDVSLLRRLSQLARASNQIQRAWAYLDNAAVPAEMAELSIERQGLAAALAPDSLLRFSRGWGVLSRQAADFQTRYAAAYRAHHQRTNRDLPAYEADRSSGRLKLRALGLLNTMPELGQPAGVGLLEGLQALEQSPPQCALTPDELDLNETPWCAACHLTLEQALPTEALSRLLTAINAALGEKNRRLSNLLVERILHGQVDQRLEDFLKIVQASDLSALSNTLTEELAAFIQRMLR